MRCVAFMAMLFFFCSFGVDLTYAEESSKHETENPDHRGVIIVDVRTAEHLRLRQNVCPRLSQLIANYINAKYPHRFLTATSKTAGPDPLYLQVLISRYDNGNPFPGVAVPGGIRLNGEVTLSDSKMKKLVVFKVSKTLDRRESSEKLPAIEELVSTTPDRDETSKKLPTIEELEPAFVQEIVKGIVLQGG